MVALAATACQADVMPGDDGPPGQPGPSGGTGGTFAGTGGGIQPGAGGHSGVPGGGSGGGTAELPAYAPYPGLLRRLTRSQFGNAVEDLTGSVVDESLLEADSFDGDFSTVGAGTATTSARGAESYLSAAEAAVESLFADATRRRALTECAPANASDPCIGTFLASFGERAWRRPLDSAEVTQLSEVATKVSTELGSAEEGLKWATIAVLASPHFVYRPELGDGAAGSPTLALDPYEVASRLAFLLWNTAPDEELLADAAAGRLSTPAQIRSVAERLLSTPRGHESVGAFAYDYMRLDRVMTQAKDAGLFPEYGPALQKGMVTDMRSTWELNAFEEEASALELFSTTRVVANAALAKLYGLDATGLDDETFRELSLPADGPRLGILSKMGFLSQFANQKEGSPTLRGKFIREALMCTPVQPPPGGVALEVPESTEDKPMTKRQRLEVHRESPVCADCHALMDPLGLPLESFDAIGRYRTTDSGLPIDPSGDFDGIAVNNAAELAQVMSGSDTIATCLVRKYYTYATGHPTRDVDERAILALAESFKASGYRMKSLILDLVSSEAFTAVAPQE